MKKEPLTHPQERIWYDQLVYRESSFANMVKQVPSAGSTIGKAFSMENLTKEYLAPPPKLMNRCFGEGQPLYEAYHDKEWGVPVTDDKTLFEFLILESAQAGLNWYTILKRRPGYRQAFKDFDPEKVAQMTDEELEALRENPAIIRNKRKIYSARTNARVFLEIQKEKGSFSQYLWSFVDHKPIVNQYQSDKEVPAMTPLSKKIAKDLKKRGMVFVGPTIIYAYMQAVGLVDDHLESCWKRQLISAEEFNG